MGIGPIIGGINRLIVQTDEPDDVRSFFTRTFGLQATPLAMNNGYASTRIWAGSVSLDCGSSPARSPAEYRFAPKAALTALSFRPRLSVSQLSCELQRRGFQVCSLFHKCSGKCGREVQTLAVPDIVQPRNEPVQHLVQISDSPQSVWPDVSPTPPRGGNRLWGDIAEVWIEAGPLHEGVHRWASFLYPNACQETGVWRFSQGPALRLLDGNFNRLRGFVVTTPCLKTLADVLRSKDIEFCLGKKFLGIDPVHACHLQIAFTAADTGATARIQ